MKKFATLGVPVLVLLILISNDTAAQKVSFESGQWDIQAKDSKVVDHLGRRSLLLKGGMALVKDAQFTDGVIEFDIAFTGERGFMGAIWRVQDRNNFEEFYVRPHQSGNPDANQYEPVFNGVSAWQLYHGDGYGAPVRYINNQWNHVRILVSDMSAEIYINDLEQPALFVNELKRLKKAGKIGLSVGDFAPAYFSNFSFASARPTLKGKAKPAAAIAPGTVMEWMVSNAFDAKMLGGKYDLTPADVQPLKWTKLNSENTGLANLAMVQGVTDQANTVFARLKIQSEMEHTKTLQFGFSDSVKVYINNRLVFGGNDTYRTRDYRFLGTIGFFDELYLPLKRGENEILFAVTEDFGGWGLMARFDDTSGIRLIN